MRGRWRLPGLTAVGAGVAVVVVVWIVNARLANHWLAIHTGTVDEPGPYYAFWSGFGSDLAEFGIIGAIATGTYQLVRKYNCHQPGCWRVGNHPAAGGEFFLCYQHHPDYHGVRPTAAIIARLHREHLARQAALHDRIEDIHQRLDALPPRRDQSTAAEWSSDRADE